MRARQVLAVRALLLEEVGDGVEPEAVDPEVEPEAQHLDEGVLHLGVLEVEVGLVAEEAVPVVGAAGRIPRPVRGLGVDEDDARVLVPLVGVRPDVPVGLRAVRVAPGLLEPGVIRARVVHHEVGDDAHALLVGRLDEGAEVLDGPVVGVDREEVGDVVAAVAQRAPVHRQQPDDVDAEPLEVVQLLRQAGEVAGAVVVSVEEAADVDLVEDGALEPERVALEPVARRLLGDGLRRGLGLLVLGVRRRRKGVAAHGRAASGSKRCATRSVGSRRT